jgi:hypothetical protein
MATDATQEQATKDAQEKVTFSPEQQARIDEIVRESMGRAGRETKQANEELAGKVTTLESELTTAKAELAKAKTPADKKDAKGDVEALQAQLAEMRTAGQTTQSELERLRNVAAAKDKEVLEARSLATNVRRDAALQTAASKVNWVDPAIVVQLTRDLVQFDEQRKAFVVLGDNGSAKLNAAYEPMSLEEYLNDFATKNPYLVRGDTRGGAGSTESQRSGLSSNGKFTVDQVFGKKSDSALANKLALTDPKEYARLKVEARAAKLITW